MLIVQCEEHLAKVREEARKLNVEDKLQNRLDYLANYACPVEDPERTRCLLFTDFAPLSFAFTWERRNDEGDYEYWMNGGLIYHDSQKEWGVHT